MEKKLPRIVCISFSVQSMISRPSARMLPLLILAVLGSSFMIERQRTLFPQPDSPTIARVSPFFTKKLTSRTASTSPSGVSKLTDRCFTSSNSAMFCSFLFENTKGSLRPSYCCLPERALLSSLHLFILPWSTRQCSRRFLRHGDP